MQHPNDVAAYKSELEKSISKEVLESIEKNIKEGMAAPGEKFNVERQPKKEKKIEEGDKEGRKKKKVEEEDKVEDKNSGEIKIGAIKKKHKIPANSNEEEKKINHSKTIDLNLIFPKSREGYIGKLAEECDMEGLDKAEISKLFSERINTAKNIKMTKELKPQNAMAQDMKEVCPENEEQLCLSINEKLEDLGKKFGLPLDKITQLLGQVCGSMADLERYLNGDKKVELWTDIEDLALKNQKNEEVRRGLETTRSAEAIVKRKNYLGLTS